MKNFTNVINEIAKKEYTITDKDRLKQAEQLELKNQLTDALMLDLQDTDIEVVRVPKGFVIVIPNDVDGAIPVELQIVTKPLDYDYDILNEEYEKKRAEKIAKASK